MHIRPYTAADAALLADIFNRAVAVIGARHYSPEQIAAWLDGGMEGDETHARCSDGRLVLVAVDAADAAVAFADLEDNGHIDMLFVAPEWAGRGVASALLDEVLRQARARGITRVHVEASEAARPVFLRKGFALLHRREFTRAGTQLHNYAMDRLV